MIRTVSSTLALAGLFLTIPVAAQSTRSAALAQVRAEFAAGDINHDGVLTRAEVLARMEHMRMAGAVHEVTRAQARQLTDLWFRGTDTNHDGRVTIAEAEATMGQMFDRYDTNHDGVVSPAERAAARAAVKASVARR